MTRRFICLCVLFACFAILPVDAQRTRSAVAYSREASSIVAKYKRLLVQEGRNATRIEDDSTEVVLSPYLYQLMGPGVYYSSVLSEQFKFNDGLTNASAPLATTEAMDYRQRLRSSVGNVLTQLYGTSPERFHYYESQIESEKMVSPATAVGAKAEDLASIYNKVEEIKDVTEVVDNVDVDIQIVKPNFWKTSGKFSLQFTQNYFSDNWYKGGNNNVTMLSNLVLEANYNDQKRISWDNKLDLRLGFVTATSDSIHRYLTNNDKIYLSSKLGIKAAKNWYYTVSAEANTQFLPGHKGNDRRTYSKFLSPLDAYVSIGMDWKPTFKNGNSFSLALLPFSYKMRYISDEDETIHSSYNMVGKDFQQDFGSKIEFKSSITIVKGLTWKSRSYFFTAYKYAEAEMENVFSFQFNKYISSEVYTLWRFDDNRDQKYYDDTLGYFQFKEYFTLGLAYNF